MAGFNGAFLPDLVSLYCSIVGNKSIEHLKAF